MVVNLFDEVSEVVESETGPILKDVAPDDGSYVVIVRFRNEKDYFDFADKIGQPKLKVYNRSIVRHTNYPLHEEPEFSLWKD